MNTNSASAVVTILSSDVKEHAGSFKGRDGEAIDYSTRKQDAKIEVNGFAYPYEVRLEKDQKPYAEGVYDLDLAAMVEVNKKSINLGKYPVLRARAAVTAKG